MKATCILLIGALLATGFAYPASKESKSSSSDPSDDTEFIVVPLEHQRPSYFNRYPGSFDGFDGVLDTDDFPHHGQNPIFFPSINPFTWQFSSYLDDLMRRLRDRFSGSWNPFYGGGDFVPSGPGVWPVDIPDESSDGGETNTTSTVKIIDGHKVIINDTYYTKHTEFGTSIYKVRVVDVKPLDEDEAGKIPTEKPVESGNRVGTDDAETPKESDDSDKKEPTTDAPKRDTELDSSDEDTTQADDSLNTINNDIDSAKKDEPITSSGIESFESLEALPLAKLNTISPIRETLERNILASELNKDREDISSADGSDDIFSPDEWKQYHDGRKRIMVSVDNNRNKVNRFPPTNQNQLGADGFLPSGTIDLSNDIAINDILADQSIPLHPDVEVFAPKRRRPVQQDPMQSFPVFPGFPQPFPGGNRFPVQYPNQFPQQFPQRPIGVGGQFPMQTFPIFPPFGGGQRLIQGQQQFPVQQQRPGGFGRPQTSMLMMSFPQAFPANFRNVRP
ncbi:uncharacterized protein LOC131678648 [Topomyia yanbarensis]|uniref:uncharacterized protein LOC131678648 n=1 Tax=Topomyia yanbarensis TaxID=2498891 RepID=UPI00273CB5B0|nr:uncharacterized protein LOC131678648 [Topomyia yanbarensis]